MALSSNLNRKVFVASAGQTAFAFGDVLYFDQSHLEVYVDGVLRTLSTHYTVSPTTNTPNGTPGGTVTFLTPMVGDEQVVILRVVPIVQSIDYQENEKFPADTHERGLDYLTMIGQQMDEKIGRQITLPVTETASDGATQVPSVADRASRYFGWDAEGNIIPLAAPVGTAPVSAFIATLVDDLTALAARITLGITTDVGSTGATGMPVGTTAQRPTGATGLFRYNSSTDRFEACTAAGWISFGAAAVGGGGDAVFMENDVTVNNNYTLTANKNAVSAGPITIASGVTVTIPSGSVWTIV